MHFYNHLSSALDLLLEYSRLLDVIDEFANVSGFLVEIYRGMVSHFCRDAKMRELDEG